jgi:hypothetical protein
VSPDYLRRLSVFAGVVYAVALLFLISVLIGTSLAERYNLVYYWNELRVIDNLTMQRNGVDEGEVTLPLTVTGLEGGERLTLITTVRTETHDSLLVKTEGAPMRLYVDGTLYGSDGDAGTFPSFQRTPPPDLMSIALPSEAGGKEIRFEYTVPSSLSNLEIPVIYLGDSKVLFVHLLSENGIPFGLGFLLIMGGIVIMSITIVVMQRVPEAHSLLWLGTACLVAGLWGFCSNDLTVYLIPTPNLLYIGSSIGLIYFAIPFLRYGMAALDASCRRPLAIVCNVMRVLLLLFLLLHVTGLLTFSVSLVGLHIISLAAVIFFGLVVAYDLFMRKSPQAQSLIIPSTVLAFSALMSILNNLFGFVRQESLLFEVGIFVFVVWTVVLGWVYLRSVMDEAERTAQLEHEVAAMNSSLDMQRSLYEKLTQSTEQVRALRHDLRHQLGAIRGFLQKEDVPGALTYVDSISGSIPEIADKLLCDNFAVNAVAVHYLDLATKNHIQTDLRLVVPKDLGRISDSDMSIIVGNLFENAIEACMYVEEDKRFIRMSSRVLKKRLTFVIDNSFDGTYTERGGEFYSRKRQGKGVGISSVRAVAERYDGALKYEVANGVFMTSLYVKM